MKKVSAILFLILIINLCFGCQFSKEKTNNESPYLLNYVSIYDKNKPIYVIGHKSPDSDTICSAIAYSNFLSLLGYEAHTLSSGDINAETAYALEKFNLEKPEKRENADNDQYVLVDHCTFDQSIDGMKDASILGIIDHHAIGGMKSAEPIIYVSLPLGSTCTIVFNQYKIHDVTISKEMAGMMLTGILSDTLGLKSPTTTKYDELAVEELKKIAGITDYSAYTKEILDAGNNYDNMTVEQIIYSDLKYYDAGNTHFAVGSVQSTDEKQLNDIEKKINTYMRENFNTLKTDQCYMMLVDVTKMDTKLLCYGNSALDTAKRAFNIESNNIIIKNAVSRKKQIIPPLTKELENK